MLLRDVDQRQRFVLCLEIVGTVPCRLSAVLDPARLVRGPAVHGWTDVSP